MQIMHFTAYKSIKITFKYAKMTKSKKDVKNASKIRLQNGTKNNNTSSHMLLVHCYAFGLSLQPFGLKKKFLEEGDPLDLFWPRRGSAPGQICPKKTTTFVRDRKYFISSKFHQNPSSGSGEEVENVFS